MRFRPELLDRRCYVDPTGRSCFLLPYYEGTPIPTSVVIIAVLAFAWWLGAIGNELWLGRWRLGIGHLHPLALIYALSGAPMISRVRIPKP